MVFVERRSHRGATPAGELSLLPSGQLLVQSATKSFITYVKAIWSKPLCDKTVKGLSVTKCPTKSKFKAFLKHIERPYFFRDKMEARWQFSEILT